MMANETMDRQSWLADVPQKRVAAGALFLDDAGRLLIIKPTDKPILYLAVRTLDFDQ